MANEFRLSTEDIQSLSIVQKRRAKLTRKLADCERLEKRLVLLIAREAGLSEPVAIDLTEFVIREVGQPGSE